ncbi:4a-hydroxytetrahydrobiopterin dehydratase [Saccharomonospora glauca]|jgi:4a-hydroxytetrahydrobiopterin dehydratase|uniref:Putative pterin-4-alpha-carbinolamine dehydratase n=1 Tax=Saccharomonospora glauca K62 TaxID=928724 RepID=I1D5Y2_9PSEU|nr:4a-hydroxytetrahydrobiopterin dehydratase [Saccharomonospora glauca]EIF00357.1 pterin-4a-carbinolamine dehydratase [Saccharomonospora glauca K62]
MTELLSEQDVDEALRSLPEWRRVDDAIERRVELTSFPEAIETVNRVAELAEAANHHPDIDIRWRTVTFRLSTHSHGGVTNKDIALAGEIDGVIPSV